MHNVALFVEDFAHETFLKAMVQRLGDEHHVDVAFHSFSVRGGAGKVVKELREFLRDLRCGRRGLPDLLIVGRDANCQGFLKRRQELETVAVHSGCQVVYAIPDPHIERWLLLDSAAFKAVLGRGCAAPRQKCERRTLQASASAGDPGRRCDAVAWWDRICRIARQGDGLTLRRVGRRIAGPAAQRPAYHLQGVGASMTGYREG